MKALYIFICCTFLSYSGIAQKIIKLKPGSAKGDDARISTTFDCTPRGAAMPQEYINDGSGPELIYIAWTLSSGGCGNVIDRLLIRFADMDTLPPGSCYAITRAELNLFAVNSSDSWGTSYFPGSPYPNSNEGWVERVTGSWSESSVTWNTQPTVTATDRVAIPYSTARWGWKTSLDVTTLVQDILSSGINNGFRLSLQTESIYRAVFLASSDNSDSTLWPELVLYFDTAVVAMSDTGVCVGTTLTLHAGGADSYTWSPSTGLSDPHIPNPTLIVTGTQRYIVEGLCKNGKKTYDTVTITAKPLPLLKAGPDTSVCLYTIVKLHASGADSFTWSPSAGLSDPFSAEPELTVRASNTYHVKGTTRSGCVGYDSVTINLLPGPVITAGPDTTLCENAATLLYASGADSYTWSPATGLSDPRIANPVFTAGSAPVTLSISGKDKNGCTGIGTVHINVLPAPVVHAGPDTVVCLNATISLYTSGADTFLWSPATGLSNPRSPAPLLTATGDSRYIVMGKSSGACIGYDTVDIKVSKLQIAAGPDTSICPGTLIKLYATGADHYSWEPASEFDHADNSMPTLHFNKAGTFFVHGTDRYGCAGFDSVTVSAKPVPDIIATADKYSGCSGDTIRLSASGGVTYSWSPKSGLDRPDAGNPMLLIVASASYTVTGWNAEGCTATATIPVEKYPVAQVDAFAADNAVSCKETRVLLEASGAEKYSWSPAIYCDHPDSSRTMVFPPRTTVFTLDGINSYGCRGMDSITVYYNDNSIVRIPNSFTPNGDGLNDRVRPYIVCDFKLKEFAIYSRWGQQVFLTNDINIPWDGTFNGQSQEMGTFFYIIKGIDANDEPVLLKGDINLLR